MMTAGKTAGGQLTVEARILHTCAILIVVGLTITVQGQTWSLSSAVPSSVVGTLHRRVDGRPLTTRLDAPKSRPHTRVAGASTQPSPPEHLMALPGHFEWIMQKRVGARPPHAHRVTFAGASQITAPAANLVWSVRQRADGRPQKRVDGRPLDGTRPVAVSASPAIAAAVPILRSPLADARTQPPPPPKHLMALPGHFEWTMQKRVGARPPHAHRVTFAGASQITAPAANLVWSVRRRVEGCQLDGTRPAASANSATAQRSRVVVTGQQRGRWAIKNGRRLGKNGRNTRKNYRSLRAKVQHAVENKVKHNNTVFGERSHTRPRLKILSPLKSWFCTPSRLYWLLNSNFKIILQLLVVFVLFTAVVGVGLNLFCHRQRSIPYENFLV